MSDDFDWSQDYFHKDEAYGLNDWDPVIAYVRALMEDSEVAWCFEYARKRVLADNSLLSQTLVQHLGRMRDERGIEIIRAKLGHLGPDDVAIESPWCGGGKRFESICLEALAMIGGREVAELVEAYRGDDAKSHLWEEIDGLIVADAPRRCAVPKGDDFPEILEGIHSINEVLRTDEDFIDGNELPDVLKGTEDEQTILAAGKGTPTFTPEAAERILATWRSFPWPGPIEHLSGDGHTTEFELKHRVTDHIHDIRDPFSDFGIFLSHPKVEYPVNRRRWASSHTFLYFQIPDGSFWGQEYTWSVRDNTITTHFREHVELEEVALNEDGRSVTSSRTPISTAIETRGNHFTKTGNSAVRGVWDNPDKQGRNYYVRRGHVLLPYRHLCYFQPLHSPLINQLGIWLVDETEHPERFFDHDGNCVDIEGVVEELLIPLHEPKVTAWNTTQYRPAGPRDRFGKRLPRKVWPELTPVPDASRLDPVMGIPFEAHCCGAAGWERDADNGYRCGYDINSDGVIDEQDRDILARHAGKVYRQNLADFSYFGKNWLSNGYGSRSRNFDEEPPLFVCSYDYGAGYDSDTGSIRLFDAPDLASKLYVEYHCDVPAREGRDSIKVYLHEPI